ncbi:beta strand repeat-containing protein [Streptomyces violaceusniger]|uniref:Ig domain protein group 1 domain protein n=1 Tax=Streptomyces violaceusniger (strain Tu 4113) TaxID=653045 RepID=G2NWY0_STRV4|nr:Ig-like domain-containing protein [Streptomyces violaceusniger]AEM87164.1 Ig domain protein group 1 domain protein [Streptomyces violaceusniger Tu 4113]
MSTTVVTSTPNPSVFGQTVTYTATVTGITAGTPPWGDVTFTITGGPTIGPVTLTQTGADSGTASVTDSTPLTAGPHQVTANFVNIADPTDNSSGTTIQLVNQSATATTVTFVPPAPVCGETVTLTANVAAVPPGTGTPTGTVTFIVSADGPTVTGTLDGAGNASVTVPALSVGTHQVAAFYNGDTNFAASNSALTPLTVNPADSTTTLTVSPAAPVCGEEVTLCAQVTVVAPGTCTPTGTVMFAIDGVPFVVAALDASGQACVTADIPVGTHTVTATYNGNGNVAGSTGTGTVTVGQGASTTTVTVSPAAPVCGEEVTLCAQVTVTPPSTCTPTGTVTFVITGGPVLTGMLDATGQACVTTSDLTAGSYTVTATYAGDTGVASSTGSASFTVGQGTSTTTVSVSPSPTVCGELVTICANVTVAPPSTCLPTGNVTFVVSGGPTLTGTLNASGQACVTTNAIPVGAHTVTATYAGDGGVTGSTGTGSVTVNQASSTTVLTITPSTASCGETVSLCAQVTTTPPGTCVPTGTVTFTIAGGPTLTGVVDATGQACVTASNIPVGTHAVTATYSGDTGVAGSNTTGSVTVNQGVSTTTLSFLPTSPVCGQPVTLCAQVTVAAPSTCAPTGTVTFTIAGGPTLTGTLNASGQACVTTSAIPVGTHAVTATYGGNTGVAGSSASGSITVGQAASTTTLTIPPASPVCGQPVTLCAQVTTNVPGTCAPTGTVTFVIAGGPTLTGTLNASGQACVTTSAIPVGTHAVTATYGGNTGVAGSSASGSITVGQASTTTTLTSSPNPSAPGQNVTFTATVTPVPPATGTPTGTVTFVISGGPTLTGTLNASGVATASTSTLTTGAHTVTATYNGDTCFGPSTSPTITQNVVSATVGTTVTATPATIRLRFNGTLIIPTLSATLRDASNNPVPGQTLTFVANSVLGPLALGSAVTNAGGTATLSNVTVPPTILTASTYTASFGGAPGLSPSSGSASLTFQPTPILP